MLSIKRLSSDGDDAIGLQQLLEGAQRYSQILDGTPVSPNAATEMLEALPPGSSHGDKFVLGFYSRHHLVACADVIRGYPNPDTAFIGLLLVAEAHEGKG